MAMAYVISSIRVRRISKGVVYPANCSAGAGAGTGGRAGSKKRAPRITIAALAVITMNRALKLPVRSCSRPESCTAIAPTPREFNGV